MDFFSQFQWLCLPIYYHVYESELPQLKFLTKKLYLPDLPGVICSPVHNFFKYVGGFFPLSWRSWIMFKFICKGR